MEMMARAAHFLSAVPRIHSPCTSEKGDGEFMNASSVGICISGRLVIKLQRAMMLGAAALSVIGLLGHFANFALGLTAARPAKFVYKFIDLNNENNLPTWFSSMLLGLCAIILLLIAASNGKRWQYHWILLGLAFLFLSLDEFAGLHERLIQPMHRMLGLSSGIFTNIWVLAALPIVAVFGAVLIPFIRELPPRTAGMFLLAGAIYIGGAAGVELISGLMKNRYGVEDVRFALCTWVEETLELAGVVLFFKAVSDYALMHNSVMQPDKAQLLNN
jgi:hypothetical protein